MSAIFLKEIKSLINLKVNDLSVISSITRHTNAVLNLFLEMRNRSVSHTSSAKDFETHAVARRVILDVKYE